jgi:hypothetical protein
VTAFKLVIGAAALWPVLFLMAAQRDPPAPVPDAVWPDDPPAAPKADRLPLNVPAPVAVATPEPLALATAADIEQSRVGPKRKTVSRGDICTRHGMHKVFRRGHKSWRCRR